MLPEIEQLGDAAFGERENASLVDYAEAWLLRGETLYRALYLGERAKMAYDPDHDGAQRNAAILALLKSDACIFDAELSDAPANLRDAVAEGFAEAAALFSEAPTRQLDVLMVGDCLHLDIVSFLIEPMARAGIAIAPHFITDKNAVGVAAKIRKLRERAFDVVFYSPFTYENGLNFPPLLNVNRETLASGARASAVASMFEEVETVARALAMTFSAPIFVHNSAVLSRHTGTLRQAVRRVISSPLRVRLRNRIDAGVDDLISRLNAETFPHLHKLDETSKLRSAREEELGEYLHHNGLQHPARLGMMLAQDYALALETVAHLFRKKLLACDLDNTLWEGEIGEGAVRHYADRQALLKRLRDKGVLLATLSKNDPANVHWEGARLAEDDFVAHNISWSPKALAFPRMEQELNLKRKDFVMLDDRADERALVVEAHPAVRAFDATSARVWEMFALWERMLDDSPEMDRTRMYRDRAQREAEATVLDEDDEAAKAAMFAGLKLKLRIWQAGRKDLQRATELVNRTNQFNTTGARVSFAQMLEWSESQDHRVYLAAMSDRFGDMGVISVLAADASGSGIEIPVFVLSCRVFGYEAETALLGELKRWAVSLDRPLRGEIIPTAVNGPCRDVYDDNGFDTVEGAWIWSPQGNVAADPEWLRVLAESRSA